MIGYYPEFFEGLAGNIYERGGSGPRPGEPWEPYYEADDPPSDTLTELHPQPAPWAVSTPWKLDANHVTTAVEVTPNARDLLDPAKVDLEPDGRLVTRYFFKPKSRRSTQLPADAIAVYRPWHLWGEHWGIYVSADALLLLTGALSRITQASPEQLAPLALRQVLAHEWTHFAFEVAATEVEDVLQQIFYPGYVLQRFGIPTMWSQGPAEEIVASWAEFEFARHPPRGFGKLRPKGYRQAVEQLLSASPPGYSEWHWMDEWHSATEVIEAVMSFIADRPIGTFRWTEMSDHENAQVPVYWVGDPATASAFGGFPKRAGPPSIKRLEKWLRSVIGARELPRRGKGSHRRWQLPDGRGVGFATSAGFLLPPEAKQIASALDMNKAELFEHVAAMRQPVAFVP